MKRRRVLFIGDSGDMQFEPLTNPLDASFLELLGDEGGEREQEQGEGAQVCLMPPPLARNQAPAVVPAVLTRHPCTHACTHAGSHAT